MPRFTLSTKHKKRLKKALPFLYSGGVFVGCLVCALLVWAQYLTTVPQKTTYLLLNDADNSVTAPLQDGVPLTQSFETYIPVCGVGVFFSPLSGDVAGTLEVQIVDLDTGETLGQATGNIAEVHTDAFTSFALDTPITTWDVTHQYQIVLTAHYTSEGEQLALKKSDTEASGMYGLTENAVSAEGSLLMMVTYDQLGSTPVQCYFGACVLFALCAAALCYLCFFAKGKYLLPQPVLAFIAIVVVGVFYQLALPAFSTPDELSHYNTAYAMTNEWFGLVPQTEGATIVKRATDAQEAFVDYSTDAYTYRYIADHFWKGVNGLYVEENVTLLGPYHLPYYISAMGLAFGQLVGWGGILTTFFARTLNLIFFAAMVALSVKLAPFGKKIFLAVALLPISLHVGGSFSYDSCLLALSFVILALGLRLISQRKRINWYELGIFALLCFLLGPLKMAYFPLTFFAIFLPAKRFAKRWQCYLARVGIPLLSFLHFFARSFILVRVQLSVQTDMQYAAGAVQATAQAASTAVSTAATAVAAAAPVPVGTYTVSTLLAYPGLALKLVINTFFTNFTGYFTSMLGGSLGYQNLAEININSLLVFGCLAMLCFATLRPAGERALPPLQRLTFGFSGLCVLGILVIACFSWTLITYLTIWGFQGRYLLPALPFVLYAIQPNSISIKTDGFVGMLFYGVMLNFMVLLNVVSITFLR